MLLPFVVLVVFQSLRNLHCKVARLFLGTREVLHSNIEKPKSVGSLRYFLERDFYFARQAVGEKPLAKDAVQLRL